MPTVNDITGDFIISKNDSQKYRDKFDSIDWSKGKTKDTEVTDNKTEEVEKHGKNS